MKRVILFLIALVLMLSSCGIGGRSGEAEQDPAKFEYTPLVLEETAERGYKRHLSVIGSTAYFLQNNLVMRYDVQNGYSQVLEPTGEIIGLHITSGGLIAAMLTDDGAVVARYALDGTMIQEISEFRVVYPEVFDIRTDTKENIYILNGSEIRVFNNEATEVCRIEQGMTSEIFSGVNSVYAAVLDGSAINIYAIDLESQSLVLSGAIPQESAFACFGGNHEFDYLYNANKQLLASSWRTEQPELLLDWSTVDVPIPTEIVSFAESDFMCIVDLPSSHTSALVLLTSSWVEPLSKTELTLALFCTETWVMDAIAEFNMFNDSYRIRAKTYEPMTGLYGEEININGVQRLILEITSGEIPDIIDVSGLPVVEYSNKGLFEDLYTFIDADPELTRADILPNVRTALEIDGALYQTLSDFQMKVVVGQAETYGSDIGWELGEFERIFPNPATPVFEYPREYLLDILCAIASENFVSNTDCNFDSGEFVYLLKLAKAHVSWRDMMTEELPDEWSRRLRSSHLLQPSTVVYPNDMQYFANIWGAKNFVFKGYPYLGNLLSLDNRIQLAITAPSKNKDVAWQFVRSFFMQDFQRTYIINATIPTNTAEFERRIELNSTATFDSDDNELEISEDYFGKYYAASQEEVTMFRKLVESCETVFRRNLTIARFIYDELPAYFADYKTAEETAAIIQSRANLYVGEH